MPALPHLAAINAVALAYVLGSIPVSFLVALFWRQDLRRVGSGNVGTANTFRSISPWAGLLSLFLDAGKGYLAVCLALSAAPGGTVPFLAAAAVVAGHNWMLFLKFRGGKGLAASAGALLCLAPGAILVAAAVMFVLLILLRDTNTAAALGMLSLPFYLLYLAGWGAFFCGLLWVALVIVKFWPDLQAYKAGRRCLY
ncbi:MAG: glycerol-3-phosphate acyltransferase [Firmicutes bacterium]|nr:glycerol-3-phosphate acyltransferase [Bacillota bacterium]